LHITNRVGELYIEIIPSVDLKSGRCVRLYQGDYSKETVFSEDPLDVALKWQSIGAPRLHIVDLDGAREGAIVNLDVINEITRALLIPVQIGGGVRNIETVELLLKMGIERVILGTAAVEMPSLITETCRRFRDSIIIGIDARDGCVATHGWLQYSGRTAAELAVSMTEHGARRFIYTDIARDGTLTEPNFSAISEIIEAVQLPVIAAGGISTYTHLKMLKKLGAEGAIIGKAIYTGDIDLKQALTDIEQP
jgi:phosphoribosylformimino-5-aminoimidazole carboxamide ribotide isomerase